MVWSDGIEWESADCEFVSLGEVTSACVFMRVSCVVQRSLLCVRCSLRRYNGERFC